MPLQIVGEFCLSSFNACRIFLATDLPPFASSTHWQDFSAAVAWMEKGGIGTR